MSDQYLPPPANPDFAPAPEPPPAAPPPRIQLPADYYSAPPSVRPLFPRWVPLTCGSASILVLLLMFAGGALLASVGIGPAFAFLLGRMQADVSGMYAPEVTAAQKKAFETEFDRLITGVETEKVSIARLDPFMQSLRTGMKDRSLKPAEIDQIIKEMRAAQTQIPKKKT